MFYLVLKVNNIEIYLFSGKRIRAEIPYIGYRHSRENIIYVVGSSVQEKKKMISVVRGKQSI